MPREKQSSILSLRVNVTRPEALHAFGGASPDTIYWRTRHGQLQRMAVAYVPFRLYQAQYELGTTRCSRLLALESVEGALDLFEFQEVPRADQFVAVETRNSIAPILSGERAGALLREKVLRIVFQQGFFRMREPNLRLKEVAEFNVPYWLGFYGEDGRLRCRVMDAIRRQMEGGKATALFERWLAA